MNLKCSPPLTPVLSLSTLTSPCILIEPTTTTTPTQTETLTTKKSLPLLFFLCVSTKGVWVLRARLPALPLLTLDFCRHLSTIGLVTRRRRLMEALWLAPPIRIHQAATCQHLMRPLRLLRKMIMGTPVFYLTLGQPRISLLDPAIVL
jgi:hypothetical protein